MASKCSSFSCLASSLSSPFQRRRTAQLRLSQRLFNSQQNSALQLIYTKDNSNQLIHGMRNINGRILKQQHRIFVVSEDQSQQNELKTDDLVPENHDMNLEEFSIDSNSSSYSSSSEGKPGLISFYNRPYGKDSEMLQVNAERSQNSILWFIGPAVLVASFIFPSLYLRRILSVIFEDSLLTDFLILFFTEAIFYCGVAVFLFLLDHLRRPMQDVAANNSDAPTPQLGQRISSVATLVLSLIIPMVTMGLVWPWTGPAASATLAPYLVGIVVQFAFEQYARYRKSPSWSAIPFIFQVYRLHQLNRAAQLVTALSFTVRGAEMTSHNLAINSSLGTLLNVLQFLGVICIWSLSSYLMRSLPSVSATTQ